MLAECGKVFPGGLRGALVSDLDGFSLFLLGDSAVVASKLLLDARTDSKL